MRERELRRNRERVESEDEEVTSRPVSVGRRSRVESEDEEDVMSRPVNVQRKSRVKNEDEEDVTSRPVNMQRKSRIESEDEEDVISRPANVRRRSSAEDASDEYLDRGNVDARERLAVENKLKEYLGKGSVDEDVLENLHISTPRISRSSSRSTGSSIDLRSESAAVANSAPAFTERSVYAPEFVPTLNSTSVNGITDSVVSDQRNSMSTSKSPSEMSKLSKLNPIKDFVLKHSKNINQTS